ncbi:energy transducer TonB [Ponticaulis sp.]|uniref:energy transducer TonB n=1 Tax=Ponticaulis sp. TaxID=2020902 RepID=UPI000B7268C6|nr:energy transducer TonB [Ponticaulis sp.]MAI89201.1 hypothetical protein [Ponticaulis sp.]OUY01195.1 MAG: hypothetical protein CBB65_01790 [Hyphomonadaceae bacterium TMED5]|tara:strand:- start:65482 stop:66039 length:558 start_codon:yes stop_codon:yes gene_type:complete
MFKSVFLAASCFVLAVPAMAQDECAYEASSAALEAETSLGELIENGNVEFVGYVARVGYARSMRDERQCGDMVVYERIYRSALANLENSEMVPFGDWLMTPFTVTYPSVALNDGYSGECTATFDLPYAGVPQNVSVSCSHPAFRSAVRRAMDNVVFAPADMNGSFTTAEGVEYPVTFGYEIDREF